MQVYGKQLVQAAAHLNRAHHHGAGPGPRGRAERLWRETLRFELAGLDLRAAEEEVAFAPEPRVGEPDAFAVYFRGARVGRLWRAEAGDWQMREGWFLRAEPVLRAPEEGFYEDLFLCRAGSPDGVQRRCRDAVCRLLARRAC